MDQKNGVDYPQAMEEARTPDSSCGWLPLHHAAFQTRADSYTAPMNQSNTPPPDAMTQTRQTPQQNEAIIRALVKAYEGGRQVKSRAVYVGCTPFEIARQAGCSWLLLLRLLDPTIQNEQQERIDRIREACTVRTSEQGETETGAAQMEGNKRFFGWGGARRRVDDGKLTARERLGMAANDAREQRRLDHIDQLSRIAQLPSVRARA